MRRAVSLLLAVLAMLAPAATAVAAPMREAGRVELGAENGVKAILASGVVAAEGHTLFLQRDPNGYQDSVNQYAYGANDPINHRDPTGRALNLAAAALGGVVGFALGGTIELVRQGIFEDGLNWSRIGATAVGGGVSGALGGLTFGGSLLAQAGVAVSAGVAGGATTRALTGEHQSGSGVAIDAVVSGVTFGIGRALGPVLSKALLGNAVEQNAAAANQALKNLTTELAETGENAVVDGARKLFRGVPPVSNSTDKARLAKLGIAKPRGTKLDAQSLLKHVLGEDVDAGVTSWTPDRTVARRFSGATGTIIEVEADDVAQSVVPRPPVPEGKYADELEVLLKGIIQGKPTRP